MRNPPFFDRPATLLQGAQLARVVSLDDPQQLARVQVQLLNLSVQDNEGLLWARVVSAFAGRDRGGFFIPEIDDEVLVLFAGGDARCPLVIGGLWNGQARPPASVGGGGANDTKCIVSRQGVRITLGDEPGKEFLKLETPGGQRVTLQDAPAKVLVEDASGNSVKLDSSGVTVQASGRVQVQAAEVKVSAGMVKVDSALADFTGVVKCQVLQATSVIASAYTPGAGNIW